ncbi:unnamed protein product [Oikopleura dioica]|uniref:Zinc finger PHD-type domain-containing protein n=1 Tax=Oikopleura dioica TaxID=34765 RepID=E4X7Y0_OIKDI|nr:unnamed protein product [Oikopleura dioica]
MNRDVAPDELPRSKRAIQQEKYPIDLSLSKSHFQAAYLATLLNRQIQGLFCTSSQAAKGIKELQPGVTGSIPTSENFNRRNSEAKIELSASQNGSAFRRVQPKNPEEMSEMNLVQPHLHQLGAHYDPRLSPGILKVDELKELSRRHLSDSSVPQSPISFPTESPTPPIGENSSPVPNASENRTDDEKLKIQLSPIKEELRKNSTRSPLPIKKRRLHNSLSANSNQSTPSQSPVPKLASKKFISNPKRFTKKARLVPSSSSSSPAVPSLKHRDQDYITEHDVAETLIHFRQSSRCNTPATVEQDSAATSSTSESEQSSCSKAVETKGNFSTPCVFYSAKRGNIRISENENREKNFDKIPILARLRRTASSLSSFNENELQQLAPFMGLSGSEKSDALSSSDSEYESKTAKVETSKKKPPMKKRDEKKSRRVQKKSAVKNEAMKIEPEEIKEEISTTSKTQSKTAKTKKSLDNVLSDLISAQENDLTLRKFFEAEQELDNKNTKNMPKQKNMTSQPIKKSRKPSKPKKLESQEPEKEKCDKEKEKSIDDENNWVPSDETIIDQNSSAGENYLIGESDESWNSVTCFCGAPFAGRPMIECDNCSLWVHMTCGKVRKNYVPAKYVCPLCKPLKRSSSNRKRR